MRVRIKADLVRLVESLPDDLNLHVLVDIGEVIEWMADPERHYCQSASNPDGTIMKPPPGGYPRDHHYFLVFNPKSRPQVLEELRQPPP